MLERSIGGSRGGGCLGSRSQERGHASAGGGARVPLQGGGPEQVARKRAFAEERGGLAAQRAVLATAGEKP